MFIKTNNNLIILKCVFISIHALQSATAQGVVNN